MEGSRFPQRVGPWIGWLGYGALVTIGYWVILGGNPRLQFLAVIAIFFLGVKWLDALASNSIRPGRRMRPLKKASVVIAAASGESAPPVRVVFQTVLGRLDTGFLGLFRVKRYWILNMLHVCILCAAFVTAISMWGHPLVLEATKIATWVIIAFVWVMIVCVLSWEYRHSRPPDEASWTDRLSTALLLELARSWPRRRSGQLEPAFIVAGGQRLDYAGSREVVRMLESEWARKPSLLLLLFAPGAELAESLVRVDGLFGSSRDLAMRGREPVDPQSQRGLGIVLCPLAVREVEGRGAHRPDRFGLRRRPWWRECRPSRCTAQRSSRWKSPCAGPSCRRIRRLKQTRCERSQERPSAPGL